MKFKGQILTEEEQNQIHLQTACASLRRLASVITDIFRPSIFRKNGVNIDTDERIARIPKEIVEHCLQSTPSLLSWKPVNQQYNYPLPSRSAVICIDGTAAFTVDFRKRRRDVTYL